MAGSSAGSGRGGCKASVGECCQGREGRCFGGVSIVDRVGGGCLVWCEARGDVVRGAWCAPSQVSLGLEAGGVWVEPSEFGAGGWCAPSQVSLMLGAGGVWVEPRVGIWLGPWCLASEEVGERGGVVGERDWLWFELREEECEAIVAGLVGEWGVFGWGWCAEPSFSFWGLVSGLLRWVETRGAIGWGLVSSKAREGHCCGAIWLVVGRGGRGTESGRVLFLVRGVGSEVRWVGL